MLPLMFIFSYTNGHFAELIDATPHTIRDWCRRGVVPSVLIGHSHRISCSALEQFEKRTLDNVAKRCATAGLLGRARRGLTGSLARTLIDFVLVLDFSQGGFRGEVAQVILPAFFGEGSQSGSG